MNDLVSSGEDRQAMPDEENEREIEKQNGGSMSMMNEATITGSAVGKNARMLRFGTVLILCFFGLAMPHGGGSESSDEDRVLERGSKTSTNEVDDSLKASIEVFTYLSQTGAGDWHTGEPLGPGGKLPLAYDLALYKEDPVNKPYSYQKDLWPQYQDFSYVPLWQPIQLESRLHYRFFPRVWGTMSLDYNGDPTKADAKVNNQAFQINELVLKWGPESVPGLSLSMGRLRLFGEYSPVFDQFPLERFFFTGTVANFHRDRHAGGGLHMRLAAGKQFLGRTQATDRQIFNTAGSSQAGYFAFLDGIRERFHLYGTSRWTTPGGLFFGAMAGYQLLPSDSTFMTDTDPSRANYSYRTWPKEEGWQGGIELGSRSKAWSHNVTISYGNGDVLMAWSRPDAVLDPSIDTIKMEERFSRKGSALFQAVYWAKFHGGRFGCEGGAWWQDRKPAKTLMVHLPSDQGVSDTLPLRGQEFRALKLSLTPSFAVTGSFKLGIRYDGIRYLDPDAQSNSIEGLTDQAQRPVLDSTGSAVWGPSRWDREAVGADIISPFLEWELAPGLQTRVLWSGAWYTDPVRRQGSVSSFHSNATISAWLSYQFNHEAE
ncbi:MAG: hypothetical protein ABIW76_08420 [Fibrobacteria bacterium]